MTRRRIRLLGAASCLALSFALVSCDGRELVAPGVRSAGEIRTALTGPVPLASKALLPPENTTIQAGETVTIGEVPAKTWVVLEVSGSVGGTQNPACADRPPNYLCPPGPIVAPFGGADPYAPVTVTYTYEQFGSHTGAIMLRGTGATTALGLYRINLPSTLHGYVKINHLTTWDPIHGVMLPSFINLTGGFTVAAKMVPAPFAVTESAPDASGTIHYEAAPLYGLEFRNPSLMGNLPPGDLVWAWFPGEHLSDEPDFSWPGVYVYECERKTVCDYRPTGPGRMQVEAYVERQVADVRSRPEEERPCGFAAQGTSLFLATACAPPPSLAVQCRPDTLVAGTNTTCTASTLPETANLTVTAWNFVGDSLGATAHATGNQKTWTFKPRVCGTVTVQGDVDGTILSASTHIEVVCNMLASVPSDSLLMNVAVQRAMRDYWQSSKPNLSVADRREQGGYIVRDSTGVISVVPMSSNTAPAACVATPNGADLTAVYAAGKTVIAVFHTHPHQAGEIPPAGCGAAGASIPGAQFGDGVSKADYTAVNNPAWAIRSYVVDFDHVHSYKPGDHYTTHPPTINRNSTCN